MFKPYPQLPKTGLTVLLGISLFLNVLLAASVLQLSTPKGIPTTVTSVTGSAPVPQLHMTVIGKTMSEQMWEAASDVIKDIDNHEFLEKLLDSSLPLEAFQYYIEQDAMYLGDFARGLAILASRAKHDKAAIALLDFAKGTAVVEAAMHQKWLESPAWKQFNATGGRKDPFNALYTSYLLKVATMESWEVGLAAFTPCFWIYLYVGKRLLSRRAVMGGVMNPYYEAWIQEYAAPEFEAATKLMLSIVDMAAASASDDTRRQMKEAFVAASKMESMFWGMGLNYVKNNAPRYFI